MPLLMHHSMLSRTASGWVKSTATCTPSRASVAMSSPTSTAAESRRSRASSTARQTSEPIRPFAPRTPTAIGWSGNGRGKRLLGPVVERTDCRQRERPLEDVGRDGPHVVEGHRLDVAKDLVDTEQLALHQLALAEPAHPRTGVFQAEHQGTAQLALAACELVGSDAFGRDLRDLIAADRQHLTDPSRLAT